MPAARCAPPWPGRPSACALERASQSEMQLDALAGQQVVDDDLAQQRVPERVAVLVIGDHELRGDGLAQRFAQHAWIDAPRPPPASRGRAGAPRRAARSVSWASPDSRSIRSISASRSVGGSEPRPSVPARQQLFGEQRVALRAREQT